MILEQELSKITLLKLFFVFYSLFAVIVASILYFISTYLKKKGKKLAHRITRMFIFILIAPILLGALLWSYANFIEPNWITVTHITVKSPYFNQEMEKLNIVQISDLHIEQVGLREEKLIKAVNALKPDILLITGDFVNNRNGLNPCEEILSRIHKPRFGIFAILGNHDTYHLKDYEIIAFLNKLGITVLHYGLAKINLGSAGHLWLVGISDDYGAKIRYGAPSYLSRAFDPIPCSEPKILLTHNPEVADYLKLVSCKPQLVLAGHTHGGQFGIPFLRKFSGYAERSKYMNGSFYINGVPMYVNRGIGTITRNVRFLCWPEITVIKLAHSS